MDSSLGLFGRCSTVAVGAARFLGLLAPLALGFFVSRVGGVGAARFLVAKLGEELVLWVELWLSIHSSILILNCSGTGPTRTVLSREAEMVLNISKEMMQLLGWLFI